MTRKIIPFIVGLFLTSAISYGQETKPSSISNGSILAENQGVTVMTDQAQYRQGDVVTIMVKNDLDRSIWGFESCGGKPFWHLQKLTDGVWENLDITFPLKNKDLECVLILCERPEPQELKSKSEKGDEWTISFFCDFVNEKGVLLNKPRERPVEKGIYRLTFYYSFDNRYPNGYKTVYSNNFTIK